MRRGANWTYHRVAAGIEKEVGGVGVHRGLVRDWSVAQRHANDGRHVGLCSKNMDGDSGRFP